MKKILLLLLSFVIASGVKIFADDLIILRNGDIINGVVVEVLTNEIKYRKSSNLEGPLYSMSKEDVLSIKYANGDIDKFESTKIESNVQQSKNGPIKAKPASDNDDKKTMYSNLPRLNLKKSNKKSKDFFPIMSFTDSSIISTNELSVIINPEAVEYYDGGWKVKIGYTILLVNKTDNPIYIDRASCFRRFNNAETKSYFDNKQTTVSHGNSVGGGIGLSIGVIGVGLGNSSSSSHSESYSVDRFLAIGPRSRANLIDYKYIRLSETKAKFKTVSDIEYWGFDLNSESDINQGEVKTYSEQNTPYSNRYYITYSTDQEFKNCYTIEFELYAKYIVGAKMKQSKWSQLNPTNNIVKEFQKILPDFWTNSMNIIGLPGQFNNK
ncbi:MAG: hypothetical protein IJN66_07855 [Muribaculaceae bacterium]|nr:hypothetical protein [Muribaculaceae bacterium]